MKENTMIYGLILIFLLVVIMLSYNDRKDYEIQMNNYPDYDNPERYRYYWFPYYYGAGYGSYNNYRPRHDYHDRPNDYHHDDNNRFPHPNKPHLPVIPSNGGTHNISQQPPSNIKPITKAGFKNYEESPLAKFKSITQEHALPTSQSFTPSLMR